MRPFREAAFGNHGDGRAPQIAQVKCGARDQLEVPAMDVRPRIWIRLERLGLAH